MFLTNRFISCGSVTAALVVSGTSQFRLFCEWRSVVFPFTRNANSPGTLSMESATTMGITVTSLPITGAFTSNGVSYYFQGDQMSAIFSNTILAGYPKKASSVFINSKALANAQLPSNNCTDPHCATCHSSISTCDICETGYEIHGTQLSALVSK